MEDLDNLNGQQRRILHQYQSITHTDNIEESIRVLRDNDWNIENAIQNRYLPSDVRPKSSNSYEDDEESPSSTSALLGTPSQRTNTNQNKKRILSIFLWPFNLFWKLSWAIMQLAVRLLNKPTIAAPRRDPRSEADRFLRDFESTYGTIHPDFFCEGGYTQALRTAKNELKYMLAILSSEEHDDHDSFYRETLTNPELIDYLRQHQVIVWGGNVRYTEAFQVSNTLQATKYPFMAVIALQQPTSTSSSTTSKMAVIDRIEGPATADVIIRRIDGVIARIDPTLSRLRMERDQREMERQLREEQDRAYRESLLADQQKQQRLEEERQTAARALEERHQLATYRKRYIQYLCQNLPREETFKPEDKVTKISFRMANGERVIRKFRGDDSMISLYEFIEAYPHLNDHSEEVKIEDIPATYQHQFKFTIHSPFPRVEYNPDPSKKIIDEKGLWPSATLIVDTMDDEEDNRNE